MSARTRRLLTSSWAALFVFSLLMQYGALAAPAASNAYVGDSATSPFELDGNATAQTGHDWDQVYADRNGPPYTSSGANHVIFATDGTGLGDDILTGGSTKDTIDLSSWLWDQTSQTSVQDKDDIENAFAAAYTAQNGHRIAYFGLDRYSISGDATAGFWFFKNGIAKTNVASQGAFKFSGVHADGDILVLIDFSNGGSSGTATAYEWKNGALDLTPVASGGECSSGSSQTACAITNIVDANSPWPYTPKAGTANVFPAAPVKGSSQGAGALYEGGLDLTGLGLDQSCFSTFMAETRASNSPTSTLSDFVLGQFSFCDAPTMSTQASTDSMTIGGGTVTDTATLSGSAGAVTGSVDFYVCGPSASNPNCATGGTKVGGSVAIASGSATSAAFTPPAVGSYCFRAEYTPDQASANKYLPASHTNKTTECFTVFRAQPSISTSAVESVDVGQVIHDSAVLSGGYNPTGTITFSLYGPDDATCSSAAVYSTTATVNGNATYGPVSYTTAAAGTYRWIASYGGDANNKPVAGKCNDTGENDVANKVSPTIATTASASVTVGGSISDVATVSGGYSPTGTVTFKLYGPADQSCQAAAIFTDTQPLSAGSATSGSFTTTQAGTYHWIASYSGDANNNAVSGKCGDANESVVVNKASPSIVTSATEGGVQGDAISDTATVTGYHPTGDVTFSLYSPDDASCSADPIFTSTNALDGNGQATSGSFIVQQAGTYHWIASYAGDANNDPVSGKCGDAGETTTINQFAPTITTSLSSGETSGATISVLFGSSVVDQATLHGAGPTAGGTVEYTVYSDNECSNLYASGGTKTVVNGLVPASDAVAFPTPGVYYWQAHYSGDVNNTPATSACQDEVVTVTTPHLTAEKLVAVNDGTPAHDTTANPGDTLTYTITITNSGDAAATNVPVTDDINPVLAHASFVSCSDGCSNTAGVLSWTIGSIAADGGSKTVSFEVKLDASFPEGTTTLPNTVVVTGPGSNCAAESDDAACSTTTTVGAAPELAAEKLVAVNDGEPAHTTTAQPGDTLTYSIVITNSGDAPATNVAVSDDITAVLAHSTFVSCSDSCDNTAGVLTWTIASIDANGGSKTVSFEVKLSDTFPVGVTTLPNTAVVEGSNCAAESDDPACSTTTTVSQPALAIAKSFTGNTLPPTTVGNHPQAAEGDKLTYTLAYTIATPPAHHGVITDVLPAGQTYVTGSAAGNDEFTFESYDSATRTLTWTAAVVTKDGSVTYQVTIDKGANELAQPLVNTATIVSDETAPDSATAEVFVPAPPQEITQPPTDTFSDRQQPANPGFSLMLLLLGLAGFALALGFVTPVPERVRKERDK